MVHIVDPDEIMDVRLTDSLGDLLSRPGLGRIFFKEVTLWRSNKYYRVDKPDMFHRDFGLSPNPPKDVLGDSP